MDRRHHGQAADELRNQAVLDQVLGQDLLEHLAHVVLLARRDLSAEADALVADPLLDDLVEVLVGGGDGLGRQQVGVDGIVLVERAPGRLGGQVGLRL